MAPKSSKTKSTKKTSKVTNKSVTKTALKHKGKKLMKNKVVKKVVKKVAAKKVAAKKVAAKTVAETKIKKVRSFKVQLPDSEKYEGRFTGLTPYQAANKALSKYYREQKKKKGKITFSIKESTRGSKRLVYHYNGYREKLKVPVEYAIKSGDETRIITKNFKNKLTKIKKAELAALNLA
tara:strand:+ start:369 stop:905 length:537 start_codon:yes stop_codon:yes gene_type:complete